MTIEDAHRQYMEAVKTYYAAAKWEEETEQIAIKARHAAVKAREGMERAQGAWEKLVMLEDDGR